MNRLLLIAETKDNITNLRIRIARDYTAKKQALALSQAKGAATDIANIAWRESMMGGKSATSTRHVFRLAYEEALLAEIRRIHAEQRAVLDELARYEAILAELTAKPSQ